MENSDKIVELRKEKIKIWLKNPYNLIFLAIILFALGIRLYYFSMTANQPLWWDESDYMAYAKTLAGYSSTWIVSPQHNSLFPYVVAIFFKFGLSEAIVRFLLGVLPSLIVIYLTYKILNLMYEDKRIALISSFLMAVLWEFLFNSMRFHLEGLSLMFGFIAIYIFFKCYEKNEKIFGLEPKWAIPLTVLAVMLAYSFRRGYFFFGVFFLVYMIITRKIKDLLKDRYNWIALAVFLALFFIIEKFIFISSITSVAQTYLVKTPFNLIPLQIFPTYFENMFHSSFSILLYLFWFGFFVLIISLVLSIGYFKKSPQGSNKSDLFSFITILVVLAYFLFYQRRADWLGDARWYYPLLFGSFICISKGALFIVDYAKKYSRYLAIAVLIILVCYGGYYEIQHADFIIKDKLNSYNGVKQAGLFLKQVSNPDDIIVSIPIPQTAYYAEREITNPANLLNKTTNQETTLSEFLALLKVNTRIKYIITTFSEPNHPDWMRKETYIQNPQTGQASYETWQIPFANTTINFVTQQQDIKQEVIYGNITFKLLKIVDDAFVYEIVRN